MDGVFIRRYQKEDRDAVRSIAWDTAFIGEPADAFFEDREILTDFLTKYFTDYEPDSCFVAEANREVIGYLIGAKDADLLNNVFLNRIIPKLLVKAIISGFILKKKNMVFIFRCLASFIKGGFRDPDFSERYPAVLHINLREGFRNLGIGSRLIWACLDYFTKEKIAGVRLATMSNKAKDFFNQQGFETLYKGQRSYFNYILHRDVPIYILGKRLR